MPEYKDKHIKYTNCEKEFITTAEEQANKTKKSFNNEPKRCKPCREKRKQEKKRISNYIEMKISFFRGII